MTYSTMYANANGTHKLPLLIVDKYKNLRCMTNVRKLPVIYKAKKKCLDGHYFLIGKLILEYNFDIIYIT